MELTQTALVDNCTAGYGAIVYTSKEFDGIVCIPPPIDDPAYLVKRIKEIAKNGS